jgi:hypothetical protein
MCGAVPPLSQYGFMAWCLVKHRDNISLPLMLYYSNYKVKMENNFCRYTVTYIQGNVIIVQMKFCESFS